MPETRPVLSVWDLRTEQLTLGGLLNLSIETLCVAGGEGAPAENVLCLISGDQHPLPGGVQVREDTPCDLTVALTAVSPPLAAMISMNVFNEVWAARDPAAVSDIATEPDRSFRFHPEPVPSGQIKHGYESTRFIQNYYRDHGVIPRLTSMKAVVEQAHDLLRSHTNGSDYVIVHPKSDPRELGAENARLEVWWEFMNQREVSDITFVVIGNDDFTSLNDLPNVVLTQTFGNDLARDLALVNMGRFFMGTASGPAHMAILGTRPYAIFKPMHVHPQFMEMELGDMPGFPFATDGQHFYRIDPTPEDLTTALNRFLD